MGPSNRPEDSKAVPVQFRLAVPGDEQAVAVVHVRSWQVAYRGLMPDEYLDGLRPQDRADRYTFADQGNTRIGFSGSLQVNRKDWGVSWNMALEAGGITVSEEVTLEFDISATKNA